MKKIFVLRDNDTRDRVKVGLYNALKDLPLDENYQVSIEIYKENKTNEQRNFFHVLCGLFGDETGYTKEEIKQMVKAKHLGTTEVMGVEVIRSSEDNKRDEYSELIEATYRLAAEAGVVLPNAFYRGA